MVADCAVDYDFVPDGNLFEAQIHTGQSDPNSRRINKNPVRGTSFNGLGVAGNDINADLVGCFSYTRQNFIQ